MVGFQLKVCQESRNEKRGKAADVKDDVMTKHNVILVLQLTSGFVPKKYSNISMTILNHYFTVCNMCQCFVVNDVTSGP